MNKERIEQLFEAGAQFGYSKTRRHPSTEPFIFTNRPAGDIVDLEKTEEQIATVEAFLGELAKESKQILFVATKAEAKGVIRDAAETLGMPYVTTRWIGGTLTNSNQINQRIERLRNQLDASEQGTLVFKTKKEKLILEREIEKLQQKFGGLLGMKGKPAALVVIDPRQEAIAVKEANDSGVPVVALANTDCDITGITYPIVANDAVRGSISFISNELVRAYKHI